MEPDPVAATLSVAHGAVPDPDLGPVAAPVEGTLPVGLRGRLLTVGPNTDDLAGWGMGVGLVHSVAVADGRATVTSRAVHPASDERADTVAARATRRAGRGNSNLVIHGGRLLALHEVGLPLVLGPDLATIGLHDFDGGVDTPVCAHPKVDPVTGDLVFYGCDLSPPFVTYYRADAAGRLVDRAPLEMQGPTSMHDFAVTETWAVFVDQPNVVSFLGLLRGEVAYVWDPDHRARIGLVARADPAAPARWFDVPPRDVTHVLNAFDDADGSIVVDVVARTPDPADPSRVDLFPTLRRWTIDPRSGSFDERVLSPAGMENPKIDERRATRRHRWSYGIEMGGAPGGPGNFMSTVGWLAVDTDTEAVRRRSFGPGHQLGQAVFAPRPDGSGADDDGWLLGLVYEHATDRSWVWVLDAAHLDAPPLARVAMPRRVPATLDTIWDPAT